MNKLIGIFFLLLILPAHLKAAYSVTYFKDGRDADGILNREVIEISTGGVLTYETSSQGNLCPLTAGEWESHISKQELKTLAKEGLNIIEEQKKYKIGEDDNERDINHHLMLRVNRTYHTTKIYKYTSKVRNYLLSLKRLAVKSIPINTLSIQTTIRPKEEILEVTFHHEGSVPTRLFLPKKASHSFYTLEGQSFSYKTVPDKFEIILDSNNPSHVVQLDLSKTQGKIYEVFYTNQAVIHHEASTSTNQTARASEMRLCSIVDSSED